MYSTYIYISLPPPASRLFSWATPSNAYLGAWDVTCIYKGSHRHTAGYNVRIFGLMSAYLSVHEARDLKEAVTGSLMHT
jgi:hypothetical protein